MYGREREGGRETKRVTERETEDCYDWHHVKIVIFKSPTSRFFNRVSSQPERGTRHLHLDWRTKNWRSLTTKNFHIIYFLNAHSFFFSLNSRDSFPLSFVYPKTQVQYPVWEIHNNRWSKVNMQKKKKKKNKKKKTKTQNFWVQINKQCSISNGVFIIWYNGNKNVWNNLSQGSYRD